MTYTSKSPIKINTTNVQEIREILTHFDDALVDHEARISAGGGGGGDPVITPIYQFSCARRLETGTANPGEIYRADSSSAALSYDANGLCDAVHPMDGQHRRWASVPHQPCVAMAGDPNQRQHLASDQDGHDLHPHKLGFRFRSGVHEQ